MTQAATLPADTLAPIASTDIQRLAARMAQDVFAGAFRQSLESDAEAAQKVMQEVAQRCQNWCQAGDNDNARALRLALLIAGLDQWGLAYSQAFNLNAIPALSTLIGQLRTRLDVAADARFQRYFDQVDQQEADAIDFKVELRRAIHLALWHAMVACETAEQAANIGQTLGSLMLALVQRMPGIGWRLLADALASIQMSLLEGRHDTPVAHNATQQLFESLRQTLPANHYRDIMGHATQAVIAWQQSKRAGSDAVH